MSTVAVVFCTLGFAALGSFTNVVISRLPKKLDEPNEYDEVWDTNGWTDVVSGRSHCDGCGAEIRATDNLPVVSYLVLRGRCRSCGESIPVFHLCVELAAPLLFLWAWLVLGWSWLLLPPAVLIVPGLAIAVIDLRTLMVPTRLVWPAFFAVVAACVVGSWALDDWGRLLNVVIATAVLAGPLFLIWFALPHAMGFGDVRLATLLGPVVGFASGSDWAGALMLGIVAMALSAILGIVIGVGALGARGRKAKVPFGPSMVLGSWICALYGPQILDFWGIAA